MTNTIISNVTFGSAWRNRAVTKQEASLPTDPADKQINEYMLQPTAP